MKKLLSVAIAAVLTIAAGGCGTGDRKESNDISGKDSEAWFTEENMVPFWKNEKIIGESILPIRENGNEAEGKLLFTPTEIESVVSYDISKKRTVVYTEGKDFEVIGNSIKSIDGALPFLTDKQLSGEEKLSGFDYSQIPSTDSGLYLPFTEGTGFIERQIYVTYKYEEKWGGSVPGYEGEILSAAIEKLRNKKEFNLFIYGDSISTGANSTGYLKVYPYAESWPEAVCSGLEKQYQTKINFLNKSVGGWTSENAIKISESIGWVGGVQISQPGIAGTLNEMPDYKPDLAILGFGMNDATNGIGRKSYKTYMQRIMTVIRQRNPQCEFILLGTMIANPKAYNQSKGQIEYFNELEALARENNGTVAVNIGRMHADMLKKGKRYVDMTGNNVNHPNDFLASVYAMNILSLLIK